MSEVSQGPPREPPPRFSDLIGLLSGLYSDPEEALDVARRADLPIDPVDSTISSTGGLSEVWLRIVEEADRRDSINALLRVAKEDFPDSVTREHFLGAQPTFLPIAFLEVGLERARSVVLVAGPRGQGTGFLIRDDLLITNHHIIRDEKDARETTVRFGYEKTRDGAYVAAAEHGLDPDDFFATSDPDGGDDWTAVRVKGNPCKRWGGLELTANNELAVDDLVSIIQHPGGQAKQIALHHNSVIFVNDHRVRYLTEAMPGSSGAPLFDSRWRVVAMHCGDRTMRNPTSGRLFVCNEGVRIDAIIPSLPRESRRGWRRLGILLVDHVLDSLRRWRFAIAVTILLLAAAAVLWTSHLLDGRRITDAGDLIPGYGLAFPSRNLLDGDLDVELRPCNRQCLPGVERIAEMRGSLGIDSFAVLGFLKPGALLNIGHAQMAGPSLKVRMAGYTPDLGIEITVKDSASDEARFRCSVPPDAKVHDFFLPRSVLDERRVDLDRIQLIALGPSTSARSPSGRFELKFYGMVSTSDTAGLEPCDGLLRRLDNRPVAPAERENERPSHSRPNGPSLSSGSLELIEQLASARALLHQSKYGDACRAFEAALENPQSKSAAIDREEIATARAEYEKDNFQESARHFEKAFSGIRGGQP